MSEVVDEGQGVRVRGWRLGCRTPMLKTSSRSRWLHTRKLDRSSVTSKRASSRVIACIHELTTFHFYSLLHTALTTPFLFPISDHCHLLMCP